MIIKAAQVVKLGIACILCISLCVASDAFAAKGGSRKGKNKGNIIGIKNTGTVYDGSYLLKSQRQQFGNTKQAEKKGFISIATVEAPASQPSGYQFSLSGNGETPPIETNATGECLAVLNADSTMISVKCTHDAESPTAAHIHRGAAGESGPVICVISNDGASPISAECALTDDQLAALRAGELYINVHTETNIGGEIRGQISNGS